MPVRVTFYGEVRNAQNVVGESRNIAYTNLFLGLHIDPQYVHSSVSAITSIYPFPHTTT